MSNEEVITHSNACFEELPKSYFSEGLKELEIVKQNVSSYIEIIKIKKITQKIFFNFFLKTY